jgi:hypothetical protein
MASRIALAFFLLISSPVATLARRRRRLLSFGEESFKGSITVTNSCDENGSIYFSSGGDYSGCPEEWGEYDDYARLCSVPVPPRETITLDVDRVGDFSWFELSMTGDYLSTDYTATGDYNYEARFCLQVDTTSTSPLPPLPSSPPLSPPPQNTPTPVVDAVGSPDNYYDDSVWTELQEEWDEIWNDLVEGLQMVDTCFNALYLPEYDACSKSTVATGRNCTSECEAFLNNEDVKACLSASGELDAIQKEFEDACASEKALPKETKPPGITLPGLPDVSAPDFTLPNISVPTISVPEINIPGVNLPGFSIGNGVSIIVPATSFASVLLLLV